MTNAQLLSYLPENYSQIDIVFLDAGTNMNRVDRRKAFLKSVAILLQPYTLLFPNAGIQLLAQGSIYAISDSFIGNDINFPEIKEILKKYNAFVQSAIEEIIENYNGDALSVGLSGRYFTEEERARILVEEYCKNYTNQYSEQEKGHIRTALGEYLISMRNYILQNPNSVRMIHDLFGDSINQVNIRIEEIERAVAKLKMESQSANSDIIFESDDIFNRTDNKGYIDDFTETQFLHRSQQSSKVNLVFSSAERFLIGHDIESIGVWDNSAINEAFCEAQKYYVSKIPHNNSYSDYNQQLFQKIKSNDISIRFLYSQSPYKDYYVVSELFLDFSEAVKYGFDWYKSIDNGIYDVYDIKDIPNDLQILIDKAQKLQNNLVNRTIPNNEINEYALFALLNAGYSFQDLFKMHYNIDSLVRFGLEKDILTKYYSENVVSCAVERAKKLFDFIESPALGKYEKYGPKYLAKKFNAKAVLEVFSVEEIYHAFNIDDILQVRPMISAKALKRGGYDAKEMAAKGFSLRQLAAVGFETDKMVVKSKTTANLSSNAVAELAGDLLYEIEEDDDYDNLCNSEYAELLRRLKERGLRLNQIKDFLPFMIDSSPCCVKWLLMAQYTIDELEEVGIAWREYFKDLPLGCTYDNEVEKYQYDGVLPLELLKAGISIDQIRNVYDTEDYKDFNELVEDDVHNLRNQGYTAKAFYNMHKTLDEIICAYSCKKDEDIREMALSNYDLRLLRKAGFSIGRIQEHYLNVLKSYDLEVYESMGTRYSTILDFIRKHGK